MDYSTRGNCSLLRDDHHSQTEFNYENKEYGKNISHFETTPANYQAYNVIKISTDFLCVLYGLFKVPFKGNNPYTNRRETNQTSAPAKLIIIQLTVYFSDSFNIVTVQLEVGNMSRIEGEHYRVRVIGVVQTKAVPQFMSHYPK